MKKPATSSSFDIRVLLSSGSKIAVNSVKEDKHTIATDIVAAFMAPKNKTQCSATIAPVKRSLNKVSLETFMDIFFHLK